MSLRNQRLSACVDRRLAAYATLAGAALAAAAIPSADAAIIYSGPVNINIPSNTTGIYLNVVTGAFSSNPSAVSGWDLNPWGSTSLNFFTPTPNPGGGEMLGSGSSYQDCDCGTLVGPAGPFTNAGQTTVSASTPLHFNSDQNFMGFRFINETAGNQIQYGWLQISLAGSAGAQPRTIIGYYYENSGAPISVGNLTCPEPSTTALLGVMAAGALGVRAWRKRKAG